MHPQGRKKSSLAALFAFILILTNKLIIIGYRLNHPPNESRKHDPSRNIHRQRERTTQDPRDPGRATHPLRRVCGNFKISIPPYISTTAQEEQRMLLLLRGFSFFFLLTYYALF
ncbi:hypothetical protein BS47DRAFT_1050190 [Hydnum rufescens UP504]|uniref:Uncharacterized protein n=1 Tax=Hydnum rufescens UP504 TaxID=1448309 RepID=A0A9P6AVL6_9AGAM|nr:hypothetical protein BS47DRAFT_1050190 [Hydnum rufescens UP504]